MSAPEVARDAHQSIREQRFAIPPHPHVAQDMRNKAENDDSWIGGMAKLQRGHKA